MRVLVNDDRLSERGIMAGARVYVSTGAAAMAQGLRPGALVAALLGYDLLIGVLRLTAGGHTGIQTADGSGTWLCCCGDARVVGVVIAYDNYHHGGKDGPKDGR